MNTRKDLLERMTHAMCKGDYSFTVYGSHSKFFCQLSRVIQGPPPDCNISRIVFTSLERTCLTHAIVDSLTVAEDQMKDIG